LQPRHRAGGGGRDGLQGFGSREARWQYEDIPLNGANDHSRRVSLGNYVKKTLLGKTFRIGDVMVKLGSKKWGTQTMYAFRRMS
jgi:hypothetical protein